MEPTIVVRSAAERTLHICSQLIEEQGIPNPCIHVTTDVPFTAALKRSYEIGISDGKKWLICVDADLLLRPHSIKTLVEYAETLPESVFEINAYVLDKLCGGARMAGIHVYRARWLTEAIKVLEELQSPLRPEAATLAEMARKGFSWVECPYVVGLHDFEQTYRDILRKTFIHAHKHQRLLPLLVDYWRAGAHAGDLDFQVALMGLGEGIKSTARVGIDAVSLNERLRGISIDLNEKAPLDANDYPLAQVERIIKDWTEPEIYRDFFPNACGLGNFVHKNRWHLLNHEIERRGAMRGATHFAGRLIEVAGRRVQAFVRS